MEHIYSGNFGKTEIQFSFRYPETSLYFHQFLHIGNESADNQIKVSVHDFEWAEKEWGMTRNGNLEFCLALFRTSDYLTQYDSCLFHGAAILLHGKAYILAADSGVGKSTQLINWMQLYSHEIRVMNGDKPILCLEDNNQITVYPSPWKGKEEWGDDSITAPLGGIILLKQGKRNVIKRVKAVHYGARLFSYFFSTFEKESPVRKLCEIESAIWKTVPVWELTNKGDPESAKITYEAIMEYIDNGI